MFAVARPGAVIDYLRIEAERAQINDHRRAAELQSQLTARRELNVQTARLAAGKARRRAGLLGMGASLALPLCLIFCFLGTPQRPMPWYPLAVCAFLAFPAFVIAWMLSKRELGRLRKVVEAAGEVVV